MAVGQRGLLETSGEAAYLGCGADVAGEVIGVPLRDLCLCPGLRWRWEALRGSEGVVTTAMPTDLRTTGHVRVRAMPGGARPSRLIRSVGLLFLWTSGVHVGIVVADTEFYRAFADGALPVVREAWSSVFMASPALWGLSVALGELLIGLATLRGGHWTLLGLSGAIGFHLCLMLFGWGFWLWSLPMLTVLALCVVRGTRRTP